jgi:hypothetical protein
MQNQTQELSGQLPATQNPQGNGSPNLFSQPNGVQSTVTQDALDNEVSGIRISLTPSQKADITAYVQQQAAPNKPQPSKAGLLLYISGAVLAIGLILWLLSRHLKK